MLLLHRLGEFALALALRAVLAEDVAGEDFNLGDEVGGMVGIGEHGVDEVLFVAEDLSARFVFCVVRAIAREDSLLVFDVSSPGHVMLPLYQGRFVTDIVPDSVCKTASFAWSSFGHPRLCLDHLEEFVLVDFAVKLPENVLALVVPQLRRAITRHLIQLVVLVRRSRQVCILKVQVFLHKNSRTRGLEIWTSLWIVGQFREIDL